MRILFCGDVVGRSGRDSVCAVLPKLKTQLLLDMVILNGENAAHGFGLNPSIANEFYKAGVDVITLGNHAFDNREILKILDSDRRLIRPLNYPKGTPGRGVEVFKTPKGDILVINVMTRLFMDTLDDPFAAMEAILETYHIGGTIGGGILRAIFVDIHGEASSEKMAMAHFLDGRISAIIGTHTHIPTADAHILPKGTGYQTDAGMCGDYNSVIGMDKVVPIARFRRKMPTDRMQPASGEGTFCGTFMILNEQGLCTHIEPVRVGKYLHNTHVI